MTVDSILEQVYKELSEKAFVGDSSVGEGPDGDDRKERKKAFEKVDGWWEGVWKAAVLQ
jgi:hypothetical protein